MASKKGDHITDRAYREHSPTPRDRVVSVRANEDEYDLIVEAAYMHGLSVGSYIMIAALAKARRNIKANQPQK